jgi:hypothetical protein
MDSDLHIKGEKKCECGRVWRLTKHNLIQRDPDEVLCTCGRVLHRWTGAYFYEQELIRGIPEDEKTR